MRKWLFLFAMFGSCLGGAINRACRGEGIEGRWEGVEAKGEEELPMVLEVRQAAGQWTATFSFPKNGILDAPLRKVSFKEGAFSAEFGPNPGASRIIGQQSDDALRGEISSGGNQMEMRLTRAKPLDRPYSIEPYVFQSGDIRLSGTLYRPRTPGPHPAVAIVPGSGDVPHVAHPFMADFFARSGCVCLLYSKRGVGESGGSWRDVGFWELADDANAAARILATLEDVDAKRVGLVGFSQAGWVMPMAASRNPQLAFLVVVSGGPISVEREGYWDVEYLLKKHGFRVDDVEEALSYYRLNNQVTRTGEGYEKLFEKLREIRQRPWFKLLQVSVPAPRDHWSRKFYRKIMDINHEPIVASLKIPVLWIYGDDDGDFPSLEAAKAVEQIRRDHDNDFTVRVFANASHGITVPPPKEATMRFGRPPADYPDLIATWMREKGFIRPNGS
jgi:pimeloyl-ACP methyl ester carboxylesterase